MPRVRAHVIISGRVQGVFFRYETQSEAKLHGLSGWVKNLRDGRVEALFEGEKEDVENVLQWCRKGPSMARVSDVEVTWQEYKGEFKGFEIAYS